MKQTFFALLLIVSLQSFGQKKDSIQKPLVLSGDVQSFQILLDVIDKSDAPHKTVEALKGWIVGQLQKQIPQTAAPKK